MTESGPDHQKFFRATVSVGGRSYGSGAGRSKKEAEQQAAEAAWTAISNGHGSAAPGPSAPGPSALGPSAPGPSAPGPADDAGPTAPAPPGNEPAGT